MAFVGLAILAVIFIVIVGGVLIGGFLLLGVVFLIVAALAYVFGGYVLSSMMRYKVLRLFGTCEPILGWVPFIGDYMLGLTCNGRDGSNIGIFGFNMPNWLYNFGWILPSSYAVVGSVLNTIVSVNVPKLGLLSGISLACTIIAFIYRASIYYFLFSRFEGRDDGDVTVFAVLSGLLGLIGIAKVLSTRVTKVYSMQNDVYPVEEGGGYGDPWPDHDSYNQY